MNCHKVSFKVKDGNLSVDFEVSSIKPGDNKFVEISADQAVFKE